MEPGTTQARRKSGSGRLEALASPARIEILEQLQSLGPCSIATLASALGRPQASLYYHVHALARTGLIEQRGRGSASRRGEAIYALTSSRVALSVRSWGREESELLARSAGAMLRRAERNLRRGLSGSKPPKVVLASRRLRLDAAGWKRVQAEVERLDRELAREPLSKRAETYLWTVALAPLTPPGSPAPRRRRR